MAVIQGTNFIAEGRLPEGPENVGYGTSGEAGFRIGVHGIGTRLDGSPDPIGVMGETVNAAGGPAPGVGVLGASVDGTGVRGRDNANGTGVEGVSAGSGTGVDGQSGSGVGVHGTSNTSVGVQGEGLSIGVLGGGKPGLPGIGTSTQPVFAGVAGTGQTTFQTDPYGGGYAFSYGGWFSRGADPLSGTAPLHLEPAGPDYPGQPLAAQAGDLFVDLAAGVARLWFCTVAGDNNPTAAIWKQVA